MAASHADCSPQSDVVIPETNHFAVQEDNTPVTLDAYTAKATKLLAHLQHLISTSVQTYSEANNFIHHLKSVVLYTQFSIQDMNHSALLSKVECTQHQSSIVALNMKAKFEKDMQEGPAATENQTSVAPANGEWKEAMEEILRNLNDIKSNMETKVNKAKECIDQQEVFSQMYSLDKEIGTDFDQVCRQTPQKKRAAPEFQDAQRNEVSPAKKMKK